MSEQDLGPLPEFYPCDSCGHLIPTERAYAELQTLTVLCPRCLQETFKPCEECGAMIRTSAYKELGTGRVLYEPCVVKGFPFRPRHFSRKKPGRDRRRLPSC